MGAGLGGSLGWVELGVDTSDDGLRSYYAVAGKVLTCQENKKVSLSGPGLFYGFVLCMGPTKKISINLKKKTIWGPHEKCRW